MSVVNVNVGPDQTVSIELWVTLIIDFYMQYKQVNYPSKHYSTLEVP